MSMIFLALGAILTIVSVVPYLIDILKGDTKPNLVSWITWTLLTGIATVAELVAGEWITAVFTASAVVETGSVVVLGLVKKVYVKYETFDIVCQIAALVGIVLWLTFNSPLIGVLGALLIDLIGALPTVRHSWQKPDEETWLAYGICTIAAVFGVLALENFNWISLSYPLYIVLINFVMATVIIYRKRVKTQELVEV